jgi:hypothetical protein
MTQSPPPIMPYRNVPEPVPNLRQVATYQRWLCICILVYIAALIGQFAAPGEFRLIFAVGTLVASITAAVFVFMLSLAFYSVAKGVLLGIGVLIPIIGLIVLLVINNEATKRLKAHGVKVGLLGADPSTLPQ